MKRSATRITSLYAAVLASAAMVGGTDAVARTGGIAGYSGKSGQTCRQCHAGSGFSYAAPSLDGPTVVGTAESVSYSLDFDLASGAAARGAGFNLAVSSGGGTLGDANSGINGVRLQGGELVHSESATGPGGNFSWNFTWTAPASPRTVTFFACANPVNGNGARSGDGLVACTTFEVCVAGAPAAPTAVDDLYAVEPDMPLNVAAPGVLDNDSDANCEPLTAVLDTSTASGTLALASDGSFSYTPNGGFEGTDTFTYHVNDGTSDSPPATVTLDVQTGRSGGGGGGGGAPGPATLAVLALLAFTRRKTLG